MLKCKHCNTQTNKHFCCIGCKIAFNLIKNLNLEQYYKYCEGIYKKKPMKVQITENQLDYDSHITQLEDGKYSINLLIEGIHCGSCVWLIENTFRKNLSVIKANVNLTNKILRIEWQGKREVLYNLIDLLFKLGYKAIPYTVDNTQSLVQEKKLLEYVGVAGLVSIAAMMIVLGVWFGNLDLSMGPYTRFLIHIFTLLICVPAIIYCGRPFYYSAFQAIKNCTTNMDVPISLGIIGATLISIQQTIQGGHYTYFDAAINLIFFLLIGRYLELKIRNNALQMAHLFVPAKTITIIRDSKFILLPIEKAKIGDIASIAAGQSIPVDGIIIEGHTEIDNSFITGESIPISVSVGQQVIAGTINVTNPIQIKITALVQNTLLGEVIKLMEVAESSKNKYVRLADGVSKYFTPVILILSILTFILWYLIWHKGFADSILVATSLLVITCPCALGLAVPIAIFVSNWNLMSKGVIIKAPEALEKLSQIDHIIFDKTGTLTYGKPQFLNKEDFSKKDLEIIQALANFSKHPLCRALHTSKPININFKDSIREIKGKGLSAELNGKQILLGNREFCEVKDDHLYNSLEAWFKIEGKEPQKLKFSDELREDAIEVIKQLNNFPIEILSGDIEAIVAKTASKLGIKQYQAALSPVEKYNYLEKLASEGKKVLMIGDGLNDAAALKAAYISFSPAHSLDITQVASDVIFQSDKLLPILYAYRSACKADKIIKQNLAMSLLYNAFSIPIAICGFVNPIVAAIAMSSSSILVLLNSLRLK